MGSPVFAVNTLAKLRRHHTILRVYTQPPRPAGRGMKETPTAVSEYAKKLEIDLTKLHDYYIESLEWANQLLTI